MEHELALGVAKILKAVKSAPAGQFSVVGERAPGIIRDFHHWADGARTEAAYLFQRRSNGKRFWLLLIEWNEAYGFYVVVFPENQKGPILEIHRVEHGAARELLSWSYKPVKRDNKNQQRKEFFASLYGSTSVLIPVPTSPTETEDFLSEVFHLAERRLLADQAPTLSA